MTRKVEGTKGPWRTLVFDIETAGVQGLCADRGFMVCFGYLWLETGKEGMLTVLDNPKYSWKNCQDDGWLLRAAEGVMKDADMLVAHFGEKFDRRYYQARRCAAGLKPLPPTRLVDTCLQSQNLFRLSSNRLKNLAEFLKVPTPKMEKGRGWPDWWMGALRGDRESIKSMAEYCAVDVRCLREVYLKMRAYFPDAWQLSQAIGTKDRCCIACGSKNLRPSGRRLTPKGWRDRFQCQDCGKWGMGDTLKHTSPRLEYGKLRGA